MPREFCRNAVLSFYNRLAHCQTAEGRQFAIICNILLILAILGYDVSNAIFHIAIQTLTFYDVI